MEQKCYNAVISEMKPLLDGQCFKADGDIFKNDNCAVRVSFDETAKMFVLSFATVTDGETEEFTELTRWLFDDNQTEKDAVAVGVDFADTLRGKLGVKKAARTTTVGEVALPTVTKGDAVTITTLTQRLLATFPEFKENYKENVAKYGKFLYQDFYLTYFVPEIKAMLLDEKKNRKAVKKLFDMLWEMYVDGDSDTVDAVVLLISAAVYGEKSYIDLFKEYTEGKEHLHRSVDELLSIISKSKKLKQAIIK